MELLEQIFETDIPKINFLERKQKIISPFTIIVAPPKTGKSFLIYDYLSKYQKDSYLYIDFFQYKNHIQDIKKYLQEFINKHQIKILVLENFNFNFKLPTNLQSIIITTTINKSISNFQMLYLYGLDFEEFLLFDKKHQNAIVSYNNFMKFGNIPEILEYPEYKKQQRLYEILKLFVQDKVEFEILCLIISNMGEKKSIYQLFNSLKKDTKISKDRFYSVCDKFQFNHIVFFVQKYLQPKASKKIFIFNHTFYETISYKKNFNNLFKNMVFLELWYRFDQIYYLDDIDFFTSVDYCGYVAIPFFNHINSGSMIEKLTKQIIKYNIKSLFIITINNEQEFLIEDTKVVVIPFNNWALLF